MSTRCVRRWLLPLSIISFWFFAAPHIPKAVVEVYHRAYQHFVSGLLFISSRIPFSSGDVLYLGSGFWLLREVIWICRRKKKFSAVKSLRGIAWVTTLFYLFWGLHYFRKPLDQRLHYSRKAETRTQALALWDYILQRAETARKQIDSFRFNPKNLADANPKIQQAYRRLPKAMRERDIPVFVKPSLYSKLMNYSGISGYFNPFTLEAQANTDMPVVQLPFTLCHEVAHQYGVAPEDEANFYAYQAARHAPDIEFQYSAYFEALRYTLKHLMGAYPQAAKARMDSLPLDIRSDFKRVAAFYKKYRNTTYAVTDFFNDTYLKANRQKHGQVSYSYFYYLLLADYNQGDR